MKKNPPTTNTNTTTGKNLTLLLLLGAIVLFVLLNQNKSINNQLPEKSGQTAKEVRPQTLTSLPKGWSQEKSDSKTVLFKAVKSTKQGIKPTVVVTKVSFAATDVESYINSIKKSAARALPSLIYASDTSEKKNDLLVRHLVGTYSKGVYQITLYQDLYISPKNQTVTTITASFDTKYKNQLETEIKSIIDMVASRNIGL